MLKVVMLSKSTQLPKCEPSVEDKDAFKMNILASYNGTAVERERGLSSNSSVFFVCNKCNNK